MNPSNLTELFHTVLDGEASDEEARELDQRMAGDPGIRAAFEDLKRLFDGLARVPMAFPPEGLVAAVMANIPQNGLPRRDDDQLLPEQGVIGSDTNRIGGAASRQMSKVRRVSQPWVFSRGAKMNEQNSRFSRNRKMWIAGAIGAAVAVIAVSSLFEPSTGGKDTAGTIVPAQRYQASQNMGQDVQGGGVAGAAGSQAAAAANQPASAASNAGGLASGDRGGLASGDRGGLASGDRGGMASGDRGGLASGDRGGMASGDRGGLASGDRGGMASGDRGGLASGDRGGMASGDRGGLASGDRGGMSSGDRGGLSSGDRGGMSSGDRAAAGDN